MEIIAIMGSPRKEGNTELILNAFLRGVEEGGGDFEKVLISDLEISPCRECLVCEATGECVILDDATPIYRRLLAADKIVIASPSFFYGFPAQLKALIDRCQFLWARRHILKQDPGSSSKEAFVLLLGATGGKDLFDGQLQTIRYFLEPLNTRLVGSLLYRKIEKQGDIRRHPTALDEAYHEGIKFQTSNPK
ncbi:MAG: flavodoxin family protein [Candidatus Auribacterota bacterium]|nr:flavodoxin family protein [Candidatus Auribacterota bacterium]